MAETIWEWGNDGLVAGGGRMISRVPIWVGKTNRHRHHQTRFVRDEGSLHIMIDGIK